MKKIILPFLGLLVMIALANSQPLPMNNSWQDLSHEILLQGQPVKEWPGLDSVFLVKEPTSGASNEGDLMFGITGAPVTLPWTEGWESVTVVTDTIDVFSIPGAPEWDFEIVDTNGRLRFEAGTGFYHGGTKAATLDVRTTGFFNTNFLTANLNLQNYRSASDLELSFFFMHHGEEPHTDDRVWVRGSTADSWLEIYNLNTYQGGAGIWNHAVNLDVDSVLAAALPPQTVSATFQMRFGQRDNYPAYSTTSSDGFTFDDISLTGTQDILVPLAGFQADDSVPSVGSTVYFTDLSTNAPTSWKWSFNPPTVTYLNGSDSLSQNPELGFDVSGLYSIELIATNSAGSDTALVTDFIDAYLCTYPVNQSTDLTFSQITADSMTISWSRGSGMQVLVVAREGNAVNPAPFDGVAYTAASVFGSGSEIGTGSYVIYNGSGTQCTVSGLNAGKNYFFAIYEYSAANCYRLPALSGSTETLGVSCAFCASSYSDIGSDWISNVTINTINNNSGQGGADSYEDFTAQQTDLKIGSTYTVSVTLFMSDAWTEQVWLWIDLNQDCDFDDTGETFDLGDVTSSGTLTSTISIPIDALAGTTTMRIVEQFNVDPGPCNPHPNIYGETEDYSVNLLAGEVTWLGNTKDWNNPENWSDSSFVPSPSFNVTIPVSPVGGQTPIVKKNQNAACNQLTIESGAGLKIRGNLEIK